MSMAGDRGYSSANVRDVGSYGFYWSSTPNNAGVYNLRFQSSGISPNNNGDRPAGFSVRCFKNSPTVPTASRTTLYDGSSIATGA